MNNYTFEVTVKVKVTSNLPLQDAIDQFADETDYNFGSTEEVTVTNTEIYDVKEF